MMCEPYRAEIPERTCIARQMRARHARRSVKFHHGLMQSHCRNCEQGQRVAREVDVKLPALTRFCYGGSPTKYAHCDGCGGFRDARFDRCETCRGRTP
jgi:hypothetical protein